MYGCVLVWVCVYVSAGACASQRRCIPLRAGVSGSYELSEGRVIEEVTLILWKSVCSSRLNNLSNPRNIWRKRGWMLGFHPKCYDKSNASPVSTFDRKLPLQVNYYNVVVTVSLLTSLPSLGYFENSHRAVFSTVNGVWKLFTTLRMKY